MKLDTNGSGSIEKEEFLQIPTVANNPLALRLIAIFDEKYVCPLPIRSSLAGSLCVMCHENLQLLLFGLLKNQWFRDCGFQRVR